MSLNSVTVAQVHKATRPVYEQPFSLGATVFGKVMLVGNLVEPKLQETGELHFKLDDTTGRILVTVPAERCILPQPYEDLPFNTVVRVIGDIYRSRLGNTSSITAHSCALASDPHEPYHHLLQTIVDFMCHEKGPFPSNAPRLPRVSNPVEEELEMEDGAGEQPAPGEAGVDLPTLTSSLANTRLNTTSDQPSTPLIRALEPDITSGSPSEHLYPPLSPRRASTSPPRVAYYPKANGDLDNTFVILDAGVAPKPESANKASRHVYPPQYVDDDVSMEPAEQPEVTTPPEPPSNDFDENGDLDESFVFLDSSQAQCSRANGAAYLPSTRHKLELPRMRDVSISPPSRSFLRRRSPSTQDSPCKKARTDPYSQLGPLEREIIIIISTAQATKPLYFSNDIEKRNLGVSREHIIKALSRTHSSTFDIDEALKKLVAEAYLVNPIDQDHFIIN